MQARLNSCRGFALGVNVTESSFGLLMTPGDEAVVRQDRVRGHIQGIQDLQQCLEFVLGIWIIVNNTCGGSEGRVTLC